MSIRVSSEFSKAIYKYLKEHYNIGTTGLFQTTRRIYSIVDEYAMENDDFIYEDKKLIQRRLKNFRYYKAVRMCNDEKTFEEFLTNFKDINVGLIFITKKELDEIRTTIKADKYDEIISCVMVNSHFLKGDKYSIIVDFITDIFDKEVIDE